MKTFPRFAPFSSPGVYAWGKETNIIFLSDQPLEGLLLVVADAVFPSAPEGAKRKD
jgi:hypothetical protein